MAARCRPRCAPEQAAELRVLGALPCNARFRDNAAGAPRSRLPVHSGGWRRIRLAALRPRPVEGKHLHRRRWLRSGTVLGRHALSRDAMCGRLGAWAAFPMQAGTKQHRRHSTAVHTASPQLGSCVEPGALRKTHYTVVPFHGSCVPARAAASAGGGPGALRAGQGGGEAPMVSASPLANCFCARQLGAHFERSLHSGGVAAPAQNAQQTADLGCLRNSNAAAVPALPKGGRRTDETQTQEGDRAYRVRELHLPRRDGSAGVLPDQQVQRGPAGSAVLWREREH